MKNRENRWSSAAASGYQSVCTAVILVVSIAAVSRAGIKASAAQRDITPPVGLEIQHYYRKSVEMLDFRRIGVFLGFLVGMLTELTIRSIEIERHVVLL